MVRVRRARREDAGPIADVHVRTWQAAYRGQMPDDLLDHLDREGRARMWAEDIEVPEDRRVRVWVADADGRVVGFVATGPSRDDDADRGAVAEVYAIYLLPEHWGQGIGRALLERAVAGMRDDGFAAATLWVLDTNARTRRFYEAAGWRTDGTTKTEEIGDFAAHEVRYRAVLG